ncbi:BRCA2-interacting transcriptional repressor EMSY isoform X2 [Anabrus simplex]|uniref:BRCA2-interacting transcriptional repressor EMSY isoform X2 n=1 Tax=Anabrus simplex TaxID=316456 RepID=UPI0034DD67BC
MDTMWPMILDMSRDECKRILRRLELEAYGSLVSALRAQGELSKEKRKLLQDLASILNISMERHRAEIRRAVNDEKLATIAENIAGPNTSTDWAIEGRRLVPLMPRLVPQTAFTPLANNVANIAAAENAKLPPPAHTVKQSISGDESPPCEPSVPEATKTPQRSASPSSGTVVLSSGMSVQVKKEEEEERGRKRRRSSSNDSNSGQNVSSGQPPPKVPAIPLQQPHQQLQQQQLPLQQQTSRTVSFPLAVAPLKITLTSASNRATVTTCTVTSTTNTSSTSTPTAQKVIIVQSPATASPPSILQRSLSVPVVKTVSTTCSSTTVSQPRATSLIINNSNNHISSSVASSHPGTSTVSNIVTISTNPGNGNNLTATTVSIGGVPTAAYITSQNGSPKIRPKTVQLSQKPRPRAGSIVIPVTPNQLVGSSGLPGVQLKTALQAPKPTVHIKQDANSTSGVKLLPVTSISSTAKILPKPSFSSSSQSPVYVVNTTTSSVSIVTRTVPSSSAPRVMTVSTGSLSSSSTVSCSLRPVSTTVISKSVSKPLQTLQISTQSSNMSRPLGGKPNVIVVQKGSGPGFSRGVTLSHSGKEVLGKVIMGKSLSSNLSQSSLSTVALQKSTAQPSLNMPVSSTQGNVIVLDLSQEQLNKNSVLAEILQASGILNDGISSSSTDKIDEGSTDWTEVETEEKECVITEMEESENNEVDEKIHMEVSEVDQQLGLEEEMEELPAEKVVTLGEAEELVEESDSNIITASSEQLPSQETVEIGDQVVERQGNITSDSSMVQEMMEVVGELDPQTGIYSIHPSASATEPGRELMGSSVMIVPSSSTPSTGDIFTTALASADINLDTFRYMEDGMDNLELSSQNGSNIELTVSSDGSVQGKYPQPSINKVVVEPLPKESGSIEEHFSSFLQPSPASTVCDSTAVTVEPSHMDTTEMHIEDFTSQKVQGQDMT